MCSFRQHTAQNNFGCQRNSAHLVPFHLQAMDRAGVLALSVPHILNFMYNSACLSCKISTTVLGVGGYPLDLKKLKTAYRVKLYRTATWWGCNPCSSRLMGLFIQPTSSHPRITTPYKILRKLALQLMGY